MFFKESIYFSFCATYFYSENCSEKVYIADFWNSVQVFYIRFLSQNLMPNKINLMRMIFWNSHFDGKIAVMESTHEKIFLFNSKTNYLPLYLYAKIAIQHLFITIFSTKIFCPEAEKNRFFKDQLTWYTLYLRYSKRPGSASGKSGQWSASERSKLDSKRCERIFETPAPVFLKAGANL